MTITPNRVVVEKVRQLCFGSAAGSSIYDLLYEEFDNKRPEHAYKFFSCIARCDEYSEKRRLFQAVLLWYHDADYAYSPLMWLYLWMTDACDGIRRGMARREQGAGMILPCIEAYFLALAWLRENDCVRLQYEEMLPKIIATILRASLMLVDARAAELPIPCGSGSITNVLVVYFEAEPKGAKDRLVSSRRKRMAQELACFDCFASPERIRTVGRREQTSKAVRAFVKQVLHAADTSLPLDVRLNRMMLDWHEDREG